jgi:uncharacterized RDD family membrane protein YckC
VKDSVIWHNAHNVRIEAPLASVGTRIIAYLLDSVIKGAFILALIFTFNKLFVQVPNMWMIFFLCTPYLFYSLLFELLNDGQTPGKKICQIKVTSQSGAPAGGQSFFLRWIFRMIDFSLITPVVALISAAMTEKRQRIGDLVANTVVVNTKILRRSKYDTYKSLPQTYEPVYSEAKNLSRSDISVIQDIIKMEMGPTRDALVIKMYNKLVETHHLESKDPPRRVLHSLVQDYNYFKLNE